MSIVASCKKGSTPYPAPTPPTTETLTPFTATWTIAGLENSTAYNNRVSNGPVTFMNEASGLDVSVANPGYLWAHNDSGNEPFLFLFNKRTGALAAKFRITGLPTGDYEDMAVGPGPVAGKNYIYFGNIGDNGRSRANIAVYRFEEPVLPSGNTDSIITLSAFYDRMLFTYPGGAQNAETLMVDPANKNILIVTKSQSNVQLYMAAYPQPTGGTATVLTLAGNFPFTTATGGDVAGDGSAVMIKTYVDVFYWKNDGAEPIHKLLAKTPKSLPYTGEPQGEALCIDTDGYYTLSERANGVTPQLYFYRKN